MTVVAEQTIRVEQCLLPRSSTLYMFVSMVRRQALTASLQSGVDIEKKRTPVEYYPLKLGWARKEKCGPGCHPFINHLSHLHNLTLLLSMVRHLTSSFAHTLLLHYATMTTRGCCQTINVRLVYLRVRASTTGDPFD